MTVFFVSLILGGFWLLIKGASWLVDGASTVARRYGASDLLVGLTIVSMGTSAPELLINIVAAWKGSPDLALANIVGSCIANVAFILGASALIAPLAVAPSTVFKEIPFCLLASLITAIVANDVLLDGASANIVTRSEGLVLLGFFFVFLYYLASLRKSHGVASEILSPPPKDTRNRSPLLFIFLGLLSLVCGGEITVYGATELAVALGATERVIGLTIIALGTSLPELVTSLVATTRGKVDISIGNVVGSNIFNLFWILGISALIAPLPVSTALNFDIIIMVTSVAILLLLIQPGPLIHRIRFWRIQHGHVLTRAEGAGLVALYTLYLAVTIAW